jgi:3-oxoacyl-[acyl-carrier protein] reductase
MMAGFPASHFCIKAFSEMNPATSDFAKMLVQHVMALPRHGAGDEIASLVAYLASPEATYVTGASLSIDGGFTA